MSSAAQVHGEADVAAIAALFAEASRARILCALTDGRALAASVLAGESGVTASTASEHLARLVEAGLLDVERSGRHRYYRLADDRVAGAIEALSVLAPQRPVRSLRESTRAAAVRRARTCYDHLAGRLGVGITEALVARGALERTDGRRGTDRAPDDPLSAAVPAHPYRLGPGSDAIFGRLGVDIAALPGGDTRRPLLRFCTDWSEQRHHLAGGLGAALLLRLESADWLRRLPAPRAVQLTPAGRAVLGDVLGLADPTG
ncbi:MAG: ArsR/SmtB family transcription factor [Jatrophihabitantaceae bacterium]